MVSTTSWFPTRLLQGDPLTPYGIIVLNQPINTNVLNSVADRAALLVCADAGADQYMKFEQSNKTPVRLPDAIVGDLDSLSFKAEKYYKDQQVELARDKDQYSTDFHKSLRWMRKKWEQVEGSHKDLDVIVIGGLGGRVDQGFSQIHHIYMALQQPALLRGALYLLSEQNLSFVLPEGQNEIHVNTTVFTENVGIIPLLGLTHVTTSGLEWDVDNWPTQFGTQMSTSNHIRSDVIKVFVHDNWPLFTVELAENMWSSGS